MRRGSQKEMIGLGDSAQVALIVLVLILYILLVFGTGVHVILAQDYILFILSVNLIILLFVPWSIE